MCAPARGPPACPAGCRRRCPFCRARAPRWAPRRRRRRPRPPPPAAPAGGGGGRGRMRVGACEAAAACARGQLCWLSLHTITQMRHTLASRSCFRSAATPTTTPHTTHTTQLLPITLQTHLGVAQLLQVGLHLGQRRRVLRRLAAHVLNRLCVGGGQSEQCSLPQVVCGCKHAAQRHRRRRERWGRGHAPCRWPSRGARCATPPRAGASWRASAAAARNAQREEGARGGQARGAAAPSTACSLRTARRVPTRFIPPTHTQAGWALRGPPRACFSFLPCSSLMRFSQARRCLMSPAWRFLRGAGAGGFLCVRGA